MSEAVHPGELSLRRLRIGELQGPEADAARAHAEACARCRGKLRALDEEQRGFEATLSFDRFQAGVTRAARQPRPERVPAARWLFPAMAAAALVLLAVGTGPMTALLDQDPSGGGTGPNRIKGDGQSMELRISAGTGGPQRVAAKDGAEPLVPGERVRIGYRAGERRYVLALSVDAEGEVAALYPEAGESLPAEAAEGATWLPESLEFFGRGAERVFVVLSDEPVSVEAAKAAAARAYEAAGGEVTRIDRLDLPGEQLHRTVLKP